MPLSPQNPLDDGSVFDPRLREIQELMRAQRERQNPPRTPEVLGVPTNENEMENLSVLVSDWAEAEVPQTSQYPHTISYQVPSGTEMYRPARIARTRPESVEDHYNNRQMRRVEQDAQDRQRRNNRERSEARRRLNEMNSSLSEKNKFDYVCDWCLAGVRSKDNNHTVHDGEIMCQNCVANYFMDCHICDQSHFYTEYGQQTICKKCIADPSNNLAICVDCDTVIRMSSAVQEGGSTYCGNCWTVQFGLYNENSTEDINYRNYSSKIDPKFCSEKHGSVIKSSRIFSTEIECIGLSTQTINQTIGGLPRQLGVAYDGTIKGEGKGVEFQTQRLQGEKGEEFLKSLLSLLNQKGFVTNKTCGLHVHLDGGGHFIPKMASRHNTTNVRNLFLFYLMFEDVLASFLPRSRRDNEFCKKLSEEYHFNEIYNVQNLEEIEKIWYRVPTRRFTHSAKNDQKHHSRYAGINFHTLLSDNHLEIRFHSGTLNPKKVLEWVNLHCQIMDGIGEGRIRAEEIKTCGEITNHDEKTEAFFSLLNLPASSRKYFLDRQKKFTERVRHEEEAVVINQ